VVRLNEKMVRSKSYLKNGSLANEGVEDSLIDAANYALIALRLFRDGVTNGVRDAESQ
jgi:hypothetical protein